jgi:leucyl-tRNA synthetase
VQAPDDLIEKYDADTLRMYEMFLGPVEQSKPWDTNGIEGVYRFIRKLWRLFIDERENIALSDGPSDEAELKIINKTVKKIADDIERFSLNTCISSLMICVNELGGLKCRKRAVLEPLLVVLSPFAPHIAEELWHRIGNTGSVCKAEFPAWDEKYLKESAFKYPVSFNGKTRFFLEIDAAATQQEVESIALAAPESQKWLDGKKPKKVVIVPRKIVNIVV